MTEEEIKKIYPKYKKNTFEDIFKIRGIEYEK